MHTGPSGFGEGISTLRTGPSSASMCSTQHVVVSGTDSMLVLKPSKIVTGTQNLQKFSPTKETSYTVYTACFTMCSSLHDVTSVHSSNTIVVPRLECTWESETMDALKERTGGMSIRASSSLGVMEVPPTIQEVLKPKRIKDRHLIATFTVHVVKIDADIRDAFHETRPFLHTEL